MGSKKKCVFHFLLDPNGPVLSGNCSTMTTGVGSDGNREVGLRDCLEIKRMVQLGYVWHLIQLMTIQRFKSRFLWSCEDNGATETAVDKKKIATQITMSATASAVPRCCIGCRLASGDVTPLTDTVSTAEMRSCWRIRFADWNPQIRKWSTSENSGEVATKSASQKVCSTWKIQFYSKCRLLERGHINRRTGHGQKRRGGHCVGYQLDNAELTVKWPAKHWLHW